HHELALREIDDVGGVVDHREADADQRIDRADGQAGGEDLQELRHAGRSGHLPRLRGRSLGVFAPSGRGHPGRWRATAPSPSLPRKRWREELGAVRALIELRLRSSAAADQYSSFHLPFSISTMWNAEVSSPMWSVGDMLKTPSVPTTFFRFSIASRTFALSVEPICLTAVT